MGLSVQSLYTSDGASGLTRTGMEASVTGGFTLIAHSDFMLANTDGRIAPAPEHDGEGVYEGKTQNVFAKHDGRR